MFYLLLCMYRRTYPSSKMQAAVRPCAVKRDSPGVLHPIAGIVLQPFRPYHPAGRSG